MTDEIERLRASVEWGGLWTATRADVRILLARIDKLRAAIEWQRTDNLTQLRIYAEERDAAKHENRWLAARVERLRALALARDGVGATDALDALHEGDL